MRLAVAAAAFFLATNSLLLAAGPAPVRLQVAAREYSLTLSALRVKAGPAVVELVNYGQDAHDLRLQRRGSRHIAGIAPVGAGKYADLSLRLAPGRYSLWCSLGNHAALGMRATLVVTAR